MDLSDNEQDAPPSNTTNDSSTQTPQPTSGPKDPNNPTLYGDVPWYPDHHVYAGPGGFSGIQFAGTTRNAARQPNIRQFYNDGYCNMSSRATQTGVRPFPLPADQVPAARAADARAAARMGSRGSSTRNRASGSSSSSWGCSIKGKCEWRLERKINIMGQTVLGINVPWLVPEGREQRLVRQQEVMAESIQQVLANEAAAGIPRHPKNHLVSPQIPKVDWEPLMGYVDGKRELPDGTWIDNFIIPKHILDVEVFEYVARIEELTIPPEVYERVNRERRAQGLADIVNPTQGARGRFEMMPRREMVGARGQRIAAGFPVMGGRHLGRQRRGSGISGGFGSLSQDPFGGYGQYGNHGRFR